MHSSRSESPGFEVGDRPDRVALARILQPRGVAIVGVSQDPAKRGHQAVAALKQASYAGGIYPVHPKGGEVMDLKVATSVLDIDGEPELALICTPAHTVPSVLAQCADKGIAGAVVLALGFGEIGGPGRDLENQILEVIHRSGIRVIGPNTSGIMNPRLGLNLIGVSDVKPGRIALLVQSGNLGLAMMTEARRHSVQGFSVVVGVGNELDIAFHDYLDYLVEDPTTDVITMYVEGFRHGQRFLETAARVTSRKPIVLLKGGRTVRGKSAARSHTGAVAGSYPVFRAGMKKVGIVQVRRADELFHVAETLATQPPFNGKRGVAVLTDGGGHGTLAADALQRHGIALARLSAVSEQRLSELLGRADGATPVDLAGRADQDPRAFARALEVLMVDDNVGAVFIVGLFGGYARRFSTALQPLENEAARKIVSLAREHKKAVVVHSLYAYSDSEALDALREGGIPVIESLEVASRSIAACWELGEFTNRRAGTPSRNAVPQQWCGWEGVRKEERKVLLETEARELVAGYGVNMVPGKLCRTATEAVAAVEELDGPAVMKVVSSAVPHKSEAGGVELNVLPAGAEAAYSKIISSVRLFCVTKGIEADIRGVLVSPSLPDPVAELLVGCKKDPHYGAFLVVGLGGIAVEVLKDVSLRLLPITREDAQEMLAEIKGARLLSGHRGRPAVDREAVVDTILAVADCARNNPEVVELDVNPLFAYEHGAVAVDAQAFL